MKIMFLVEEASTKFNFNPPYHSYGWFHLAWLGVFFILAFVFSYFLARKHSKKIDKIVLISIGSILLIGEIAKQIYLFKTYKSFSDSSIPFQLCSIPMYLWIPIVFLPECKVKKACIGFLESYTFLSGLIVLAYPETCINNQHLFLCIHSMIWHIGIVILGLYLAISRGFGKNFKEDVLYPAILFVFFIAIVVTLNETLNAHGHSLCLFYLDFKRGSLLKLDTKLIYIAGETRLDWVIYIFCYTLGLFLLTCNEYFIFNLFHKVKRRK